MLQAQRDCDFGKGLIAEGRDCGTVIFPNAPVKIFLTATSEKRAQRRFHDKVNVASDSATQELVLEDLLRRDERDSKREHAPLKKAKDALVLNTSTSSVNEVLDQIFKMLQEKGFY